MKNKRKFNILCGGGTMRGVFGAGVVVAFQEENIYPHLKNIYGVSAGAMDLAYFLTEQSHMGASMYYEDLTKGDFFHPTHIINGIFWRAVDRIIDIPNEEIPKVVNIDYIFDKLMEEKPLKIEILRKVCKKINFKVLLCEAKTGNVEYVNIIPSPIKKLRAATAIVPYYNRAININGKEYVDPSLIDPFGAEQVLRETDDQKLVVISNYDFKAGLAHRLKDQMESFITSFDFPSALSSKMTDHIKNLRNDLELLRQKDSCKIIMPEKEYIVLPNSTNEQKIRKSFNHGKEKGREFLKKEGYLSSV